jgi:hypothetical protein
MIQVDISVQGNINSSLARIRRDLAQYPDQALTEFRELTPRRSGNARRRTTLRNNNIEADYAYAQRLDSGWSSQAPQGMTRPFAQWVRARLKQIFRK